MLGIVVVQCTSQCILVATHVEDVPSASTSFVDVELHKIPTRKQQLHAS